MAAEPGLGAAGASVNAGAVALAGGVEILRRGSGIGLLRRQGLAVAVIALPDLVGETRLGAGGRQIVAVGNFRHRRTGRSGPRLVHQATQFLEAGFVGRPRRAQLGAVVKIVSRGIDERGGDDIVRQARTPRDRSGGQADGDSACGSAELAEVRTMTHAAFLEQIGLRLRKAQPRVGIEAAPARRLPACGAIRVAVSRASISLFRARHGGHESQEPWRRRPSQRDPSRESKVNGGFPPLKIYFGTRRVESRHLFPMTKILATTVWGLHLAVPLALTAALSFNALVLYAWL